MLSEFRMPGVTGASLPNEVWLSNSGAWMSPAETPGGTSGAHCRVNANCNGNGSGVNQCGGLATGAVSNVLTQNGQDTYYYNTGSASGTCPSAVAPSTSGVHNGASNYIFADGHVKLLQPTQVSGGANAATQTSPPASPSPAAETQYGNGIVATYSIM
jgi:prepilin-type processing-associated H-X9-DG protein